MLSAEEANLFSESLTFEVKEKKDKSNLTEAVAALSNTYGDVILVGVKAALMSRSPAAEMVSSVANSASILASGSLQA